MTTDEIEGESDDRATRDSIVDFLSDGTGGGAGQAVDGSGGDPVAADGKPTTARTRNLRPSFRTIPAHDTHGRSPGTALEPASSGPDRAPAPAARAKHFKGWRTAVLKTGAAGPPADKPAQSADASPAGGRVRGRVGRPPGKGKKEKPVKAGVKPPALPKDIAKLVGKVEPVTPRVIVPTETERSNATRLFREIGETFNVNRKKSKTAAYAAYRHDLMANLDTLIMGGAIDLKEVTTVITNLEQYTKETEAESTETPATILGRWLRMDAAEIAGLEVPVEEVVEDEENSGEEVDELDAAADPFHAADGHAVS